MTCAHCFVQEWWDWPTVYAPNLTEVEPLMDEGEDEKEQRAVDDWLSVVFGRTSYVRCIFKYVKF